MILVAEEEGMVDEAHTEEGEGMVADEAHGVVVAVMVVAGMEVVLTAGTGMVTG